MLSQKFFLFFIAQVLFSISLLFSSPFPLLLFSLSLSLSKSHRRRRSLHRQRRPQPRLLRQREPAPPLEVFLDGPVPRPQPAQRILQSLARRAGEDARVEPLEVPRLLHPAQGDLLCARVVGEDVIVQNRLVVGAADRQDQGRDEARPIFSGPAKRETSEFSLLFLRRNKQKKRKKTKTLLYIYIHLG